MNYLIESTACIAIFYGLYLLIFRRFTFVRLNRIYLLLSLIMGLIFPLISYEVEEIVKVPVNQIVYSERNFQPVMVNSSTSLIVNEPVEKSLDWNFIIEIIYVLGIVLMVFRFLIMIYKLLKIKRISVGGDYISTQSRFANSSFFNMIFIDDSKLTQDEIQQILAHEKWHIKLFHSYDLLFVEILKMLFWFNPILWLYQRSLSEVHEYEVDTRMIQAYNPQSYAQLLLKLATSTPTLATTHHFSRKPLTDRIHFIFTKQKSVPMKRLAYLSILPILGVLFMAFSLEKVVKYQEIEDSSKYFKIVRGNEINISESDMSKLAIMRLMDDEIQLFIGFNKLTNESIEEAKSYFKDYGFSLNVIDYKTDKKNVLINIEFSLLEDDKAEKEKNRSRNYEMYNDGGKFDLEEYRKLSKEDKGMFLSIRANRKTGIHTVNLGHIPPTPPAPPRPPLAPKAPKALPTLPTPPKPPLAPVKVGMNKPLRSKEADTFKETIKSVDMLGAMKIDLTFKSYKIVFDGKKIENGKLMSKVITQKDWQVFLDFINSDNYFSNSFRKKMLPDNWNRVKVKSDQIPVQFVSYEQAIEFCKWQSQMFSNSIPESQSPDYQAILVSNAKTRLAFMCRLPTEREWEIAVKKKIIEENQNKVGFRCILETSTI